MGAIMTHYLAGSQGVKFCEGSRAGKLAVIPKID